MEAQRDEFYIAASGTLSAIVQALMGKKAKSMVAFRKSLGGKGSGSAASDSSEMSRMRAQLGGIERLVKTGQVTDRRAS